MPRKERNLILYAVQGGKGGEDEGRRKRGGSSEWDHQRGSSSNVRRVGGDAVSPRSDPRLLYLDLSHGGKPKKAVRPTREKPERGVGGQVNADCRVSEDPREWLRGQEEIGDFQHRIMARMLQPNKRGSGLRESRGN